MSLFFTGFGVVALVLTSLAVYVLNTSGSGGISICYKSLARCELLNSYLGDASSVPRGELFRYRVPELG